MNPVATSGPSCPPASVCRFLLAALVLLGTWLAPAAEDEPVDWARARSLLQRAQRGESLSPEDRAYLDRARRLRAAQRSAPGERPFFQQTNVHFTPLTELGTNTYKGRDGGLYGRGRNEPPRELQAAADRAATRIQPLDGEGRPSDSGKIVLLSIGMSNTTQEFSEFKRAAEADPQKSPHVVIVDGAQGGQTADRIADESAGFWREVDRRLERAGVTPRQVQAVWLKEANAGPTRPFPAEVERLQTSLARVVVILKRRFPNVQIAWLSSRIYGGYARTPLNPEPHAYESAFAVRGLILQQYSGDATLNADPARGEVTAPLLLWGPYLWADGATPRASDGLTWEAGDFAADGTHPGPSGRRKVAAQLLRFFKTDARARPWFLKQ